MTKGRAPDSFLAGAWPLGSAVLSKSRIARYRASCSSTKLEEDAATARCSVDFFCLPAMAVTCWSRLVPLSLPKVSSSTANAGTLLSGVLMATQSEVTQLMDTTWVRSQFPALSQTVNGHPAVFLDGPGGTQVPQSVIDAIAGYLCNSNANTDGAFATSRRTDAMLADARVAMADFFNCAPDEAMFGANMTSLTFAMSRSIGRELNAGDEIVVARLDHGANFSPWLALEERGVTVRIAEIHDDDCTLDMEDLARKITSRTK